MSLRRSSRLAGQLTLAYGLLIVYASLHPFSGWENMGAALFEFLWAPWPRYFTVLDLVFNGLAYLPFGLLLAATLRARLKPGRAVVVATLAGALLSFGMEMLQHFLPSRVPSNVDLGFNALGSFIGAVLGLRFGRVFADHGLLARWRVRRIVAGLPGDSGLMLILAWLLTQLNPGILLFGNGDLRGVLDLPVPLAFSAARHVLIEEAVVAAGLVAAGLLFWQLMRQRSLPLLGLLLVLTLAVKTAGTMVLMASHSPTHWLTEGSLRGLGIGLLLLGIGLALPRQWQSVITALALLAGTALVNLAPENPYLADTLTRWDQGHFLNFNGLTRLASIVWPYAALALLVTLRAGARDEPPQWGKRSLP